MNFIDIIDKKLHIEKASYFAVQFHIDSQLHLYMQLATDAIFYVKLHINVYLLYLCVQLHIFV
jgi:hypothetical protein